MESPDRHRLPQRRQSSTVALEYEGQRFTVTVGYYPDGRPGEVFASGHRESGFERVVSDSCVLISRALQVGLGPDDLLESLGTMPVLMGGRLADGPASPIGVILGALVARPELAALQPRPAPGSDP